MVHGGRIGCELMSSFKVEIILQIIHCLRKTRVVYRHLVMESVALLWWMTLFGPCKGIHRDMACCIPRGFQVRARKWKSGGSLVLPLGDIHIRRFLLISFSVKVVNKD